MMQDSVDNMIHPLHRVSQLLSLSKNILSRPFELKTGSILDDCYCVLTSVSVHREIVNTNCSLTFDTSF